MATPPSNTSSNSGSAVSGPKGPAAPQKQYHLSQAEQQVMAKLERDFFVTTLSSALIGPLASYAALRLTFGKERLARISPTTST